MILSQRFVNTVTCNFSGSGVCYSSVPKQNVRCTFANADEIAETLKSVVKLFADPESERRIASEGVKELTMLLEALIVLALDASEHAGYFCGECCAVLDVVVYSILPISLWRCQNLSNDCNST